MKKPEISAEEELALEKYEEICFLTLPGAFTFACAPAAVACLQCDIRGTRWETKTNEMRFSYEDRVIQI
jgi:hypothetical protein